jgi:hypothetical protein
MSFSVVSKDESIWMDRHDIPRFEVSVNDVIDMHESQTEDAISKDWKELEQTHRFKLSLL